MCEDKIILGNVRSAKIADPCSFNYAGMIRIKRATWPLNQPSLPNKRGFIALVIRSLLQSPKFTSST